MKRALCAFAACAALAAFAGRAHATANYVYHEQTTNLTGGSCAPYLTTPSPGPTESYPLAWKIEYQFYTDNTVVYYTTDGTAPAGTIGVPSGTTKVATGAYGCTFTTLARTTDVASATLPTEPAGTIVKYIIGAWYSPPSTCSPEVFANSGTCSGCTACETSSCATVFSYTVQPPDAGALDGRRIDAAPVLPDATIRSDARKGDTVARLDTRTADTARSIDAAAKLDAKRADAPLSRDHAATDVAVADATSTTIDVGSSELAIGDSLAGNDSVSPPQGSSGCTCSLGGARHRRPAGGALLFVLLAPLLVAIRRIRR